MDLSITNLSIPAIQGIGWTGLSRILCVAVSFAVTSVLAHLLSPGDFGLLAMVIVFVNFASIFHDLGLSAAIIQKQNLTDVHLSSCFWINVFVGTIITLSLMLLSPFIASFYNKEGLVPIIIAISTTFFISSFSSIHAAILTKQLDFKPLAIIEITAVIVAGLFAIIFAMIGFGVWSLVFRQLIFTALIAFSLWFYSDWRPKFILSFREIKGLFSFGLNLTGSVFINYFVRNLDNLLIGKFWGSTLLGYYNLAYELLLFPLSNISAVIGKVIFPSMSIVQDDKEKARGIYISTTRYISAVTFPLMTGIFVCSPYIVRVFFGSQWERSIFLIQVLSVIGLIQSIGTTVGWIYKSQGRTDIMLKWEFFALMVISTSFFIGVKWNIEGVAIACAIAMLFLAFPNFIIPFRLIDLNFFYFVKQFKNTFISAMLMGVIVEIINYFLLNSLGIGDLINLILLVITGLVSYFCTLYLVDKNLYMETFHMLKLVMSKNV